eukprot:gene1058-1342_t
MNTSYATDLGLDLATYKQAKKYYKQAAYDTCQAYLLPLLHPAAPINALTPYAYFYYALSAYHQSMPATAELAFNHLLQAYPHWGQKDEVLYWMAQLYFEQKDYQKALTYLADIQDRALDQSIVKIKKHFLSQAEDINQLDQLFQQYPDDTIIAKLWLHSQKQLPLIKQDLVRMETVVNRLKLSKSIYDPLHALTSIKKSKYHVAVLFPFFIKEVNYEEKNCNQFVLDLYRGLQAAIEKLTQEGISIDLHAYDTQKNALATAQILAHEEMKYMDLIIGPLYEEPIALVAEFAKKHHINVFNPLSVNSQAVGNNPFIYLAKPSLETQAKRAAEFTQQHIIPEQARIGLIYGTSPEDVLKANLYKANLEAYLGKPLDLVLELQPQTAQQFLNRFRETGKQPDHATETKELDKAVFDHLTHIYIASQNELIVANVLSAIQIRKLQPHIIGDEVWLKKSSVTLDQLQRLKISFLAPDYIDYEREGVPTFRNDFHDQFGIFPGHYATFGYDVMLFLGNMLSKYGTYFQKHWHEDICIGQIFPGFYYGTHHDNQYIPIIRFKKTRLILENSPYTFASTR